MLPTVQSPAWDRRVPSSLSSPTRRSEDVATKDSRDDPNIHAQLGQFLSPSLDLLPTGIANQLLVVQPSHHLADPLLGRFHFLTELRAQLLGHLCDGTVTVEQPPNPTTRFVEPYPATGEPESKPLAGPSPPLPRGRCSDDDDPPILLLPGFGPYRSQIEQIYAFEPLGAGALSHPFDMNDAGIEPRPSRSGASSSSAPAPTNTAAPDRLVDSTKTWGSPSPQPSHEG